MAEILLSLTIIGVVAAITLPSLTGNINERTWNTQRKALYARFSQAIALMPSLNGYGTLTEGVDASGSTVVTEDTATETFITGGLAKVLKINNICDKDHLEDCGISLQMTDALGNKIDTPVKISDLNEKNTEAGYSSGGGAFSYHHADVNAAAFETANGESVLAFYNPTCSSAEIYGVMDTMMVPDKVCVNFLYDLNGTKGPNTFGKDIGLIAALYPSDSVVVAPMPYLRGGDLSVAWSAANSSCKNVDSEYRAPNLEEMIVLMYNSDLVNLGNNKYWTSKREGNKAWAVSLTNRAFKADIDVTDNNQPMSVRCVKR